MPIDGTNKSLESCKYIVENFNTDNTKIYVLNVNEDFYHGFSNTGESEKANKNVLKAIDNTDNELKNFDVEKTVVTSKSAKEEIVSFAFENNIDTIVMARATKEGIKKISGSVSKYVSKFAHCPVIILP